GRTGHLRRTRTNRKGTTDVTYRYCLLVTLAGALLTAVRSGTAAEEPPTEWVEPATGHRVVRLSREPGTSSFYFHQNAYTASGDKLVVSTSTPRGLATIDLRTRQIEPLMEGRASQVVVGKKTRQAFYTRDGAVYATHLDTRATREIAKLPPEMRG